MINVPIYLDEINCNKLKINEKYIIHDPKTNINNAKIGKFVGYEYYIPTNRNRNTRRNNFSKSMKNNNDVAFAVFDNLENYNSDIDMQSTLGNSTKNKFSCVYFKFYKSKKNTMEKFTELILKQNIGDPYLAKHMASALLHGNEGEGINKNNTHKKQKSKKAKSKKQKAKNK